MWQVEHANAILNDEGQDHGSSDDDYADIAYTESVYDPSKGLAKSLYIHLVFN